MGLVESPGAAIVGNDLSAPQLELALWPAQVPPSLSPFADWRKIRRQPFSKNSTGKHGQ